MYPLLGDNMRGYIIYIISGLEKDLQVKFKFE